MKHCLCGVAIPEDEGICPACDLPIPSVHRLGRSAILMSAIMGVLLSLGVGLYWWGIFSISDDFKIPTAPPAQTNSQPVAADQTAFREYVAVSYLRILYNAQLLYHAKFGVYPSSISLLGAPPAGVGTSMQNAGFVTHRVAADQLEDYSFKSESSKNGIRITAIPRSGSAERSFVVDQTGKISPLEK